MGTAALVLGVLAVGLAFVPPLRVASWLPAVLGTVLGLVGVRRVGDRRATNRRMAVGGLALSTLGLVLSFLSTVLYVSATDVGL